MSEESNKSSIFLSIVIVFLLVAMGVYGFIYRDKLTEFFQKFQKKNEQVEKHTIYNQNSLSEKDSTEVIPQKNSPSELDTTPKSLPKEVDDSNQSKKEIEEMVYGNVPGDDSSPTPSSSKKNKKIREMEFSKNLPDTTQKDAKLSENKLGMEFVGTKSKRSKLKSKSYTSKKKRKYSKSKRTKTRNSLLGRVSKLERALGIKSNSKEKLEKRIERLEKTLKKQ
jgi:hypothetical protein